MWIHTSKGSFDTTNIHAIVMCPWTLTTNVLEHMSSMGNCFASWCRVCCQQVCKPTFCTSFTGQHLFLGQSLFTRTFSKPAGSDALSSLSAQGTGLHLGNISKAMTLLILPHILRCWWGLLVQESTVLLSEPPPFQIVRTAIQVGITWGAHGSTSLKTMIVRLFHLKQLGCQFSYTSTW